MTIDVLSGLCSQAGGLDLCLQAAIDTFESNSINANPLIPYCIPLPDCAQVLGRKIDRLGEILVGNVTLQEEPLLFEFLWGVESQMLLNKSDSIGCSKYFTFGIDLIDDNCSPVCHDVRKCSRLKQQYIDSEVDKLLSAGIITPILSDWQSGIVVVPKPGPGDDFRMCVDYKDLNSKTKSVKFPLPHIDDIMQELGGSTYFCKLDLAKGYYQIPVRSDSIKYTTFVCRKGTFAFNRMPFGPKNAPAVFQQMMNSALGPMLYKYCCVYLDDIVVWGKTLQEVLDRCQLIINALQEHGLILSGLKSEFGLRKVKLLGRTVYDGKIYPGHSKLQGLYHLKKPATVRDVRSLYGLISHFRMFVRNFAKRCKPITQFMTKTNGPIQWTEAAEAALKDVIGAISSSGLLLARFDLPFIICTDFSYGGLGAVLVQKVDGVEYPIMFASRQLDKSEENYSATEGEALAIIFALDRFQHIVQGQEIILRTDHRPLIFVKANADHNKKLARWWAEMQQYNIKVEYVPGKLNEVADALSRLTSAIDPQAPSLHACITSFTQKREATFIDSDGDNVIQCSKCSDKYYTDKVESDILDLPIWYCPTCISNLDASDPIQNIPLLKYLNGVPIDLLIAEFGSEVFERIYNQHLRYELIDGKLYRNLHGYWKQILQVGDRLSTVRDLHEVLGHCGVRKLITLVREYYTFPDLPEICTKVVATCLECQRMKSAPRALPLLPTNKYSMPYRCWALDYLPMLPETPDGHRHLLVCVDVFSKWVELIPMRTKTPTEVAEALQLHIFARFGVPLELRVDRGLEFAGKMTELCQELQIIRNVISTQHPQANGAVERYVATVKRCLKTMLSAEGRYIEEWLDCIPACLMALRFLQHKVLGMSPYTVCCGLIPRVPLKNYQLIPHDEWDERTFDVSDLMETIRFIHEDVFNRLKLADMRAKIEYDNRMRQFQDKYIEGQLVLMKNRRSGVFETPLVGPFEFVKYKQGGRAAWLLDAEGRQFDVSVSHLVPLEEDVTID